LVATGDLVSRVPPDWPSQFMAKVLFGPT